MKQSDFMSQMEAERSMQDILHPKDDWPGVVWATVLGEEYGEVCKAILEHDRNNLEEELIHLASVCMRIYENLEQVELFYEHGTTEDL